MSEENITIDNIEINNKPITVAELMRDNISPAEFIPSAELRINMSWTKLIAMLNRRMPEGKPVNTQWSAKLVIEIYGKVMEKSFL